MITPEKLAEIKDYCAKATAGPWWIAQGGHNCTGPRRVSHHYEDETVGVSLATECNMQFIAHARTDLPLLVAAYEQMKHHYFQLSAAQSALPATYYTDRPLPERVGLMVKDWQRAVVAIQQAEKRIEELENLLADVSSAVGVVQSAEALMHGQTWKVLDELCPRLNSALAPQP